MTTALVSQVSDCFNFVICFNCCHHQNSVDSVWCASFYLCCLLSLFGLGKQLCNCVFDLDHFLSLCTGYSMFNCVDVLYELI